MGRKGHVDEAAIAMGAILKILSGYAAVASPW